ncbi:hypothetical protein C8J57DRAFT_1121789 [Mycena rebaudengoi]|nr:hypothetical protein C8J57DRAFT_1121789 [Mycena rebaudengoi]
MLSALRPRLCLRPPWLRAFSASAARQNDSHNELVEMLQDQAEKTPLIQPRDTTGPLYTPFTPSSFIRPRDLSLEARTPRQGSKPKSLSVGPSTSEARKNDTFYKLGVDPLRCALYPSVLSQYMTEMAKIYPRRHSGLTSKSQRRIAKAIRRAKMMGIIPLHSRPRTSRPHIHFPATSASNTQTQ